MVFVLHAGGSTGIDRLRRGKLRQQFRPYERQHFCGQQRGARRGVAHRPGGSDRSDRQRPCGEHPHRGGCRAAGCRRQTGRGDVGRTGTFGQCGRHRQGDHPHRHPHQAPEGERLPTGRGVRAEKRLGRAGRCLWQLAQGQDPGRGEKTENGCGRQGHRCGPSLWLHHCGGPLPGCRCPRLRECAGAGRCPGRYGQAGRRGSRNTAGACGHR